MINSDLEKSREGVLVFKKNKQTTQMLCNESFCAFSYMDVGLFIKRIVILCYLIV